MLVAGLVLPSVAGGLTIIARLITGTGLALMVLGIVSLLQYAYARRDPKAKKEMMIHDSDERMQLIRARSGQRAFWISSSLAFFVLIWASFAGDVGLPVLSYDALWFSLAVVVVVPFIVYIVEIVYEQGNH